MHLRYLSCEHTQRGEGKDTGFHFLALALLESLRVSAPFPSTITVPLRITSGVCT